MESSSVNRLFIKAIESLGYSREEYKKYLDVFDTRRKIQTVASLYTVAERKCRIRECLEELKSRHSLLNLLFLRYTVEAALQNDSSRQEVWECFVENDGLLVLECGFGSNNSKFLNNLMEFVMLVLKVHGECSGILEKVLLKYELIDKKLIHSYLNMDVDRKALFMHSAGEGATRSRENATCVCTLFVKKVIDDILKLEKIENELDFVLREGLKLDQLINREYLRSLGDRFVNKELFKKLMDMLDLTADSVVAQDVYVCHKSSIDRGADVGYNSATLRAAGPRMLKDDMKCKRAGADMPEHSQAASSQEIFPMDFTESRPKAMLEDITRQYESLKNEHLGLRNLLAQNNISIVDQKVVLKPSNESRALEMLSTMSLDLRRRPRFSCCVLDRTSCYAVESKTQRHEATGNGSTSLVQGVAVDGSHESEAISTAEASKSSLDISGRFCGPRAPLLPEESSAIAAVNNAAPVVREKRQVVESGSSRKPRFGAGKFGIKARPKKSVLVSDKSYTGIRWKKVSKSQSLIFSKISYEDSEKLFELAEFDKFEHKQEKRAHSERLPEKVREAASSACMDPKKSYALNIALGRVRMGNGELISKIAAQECEDENLIKQLIMYFPTSEEVDLIRGCKAQLSRAEMLFEEASDLKVFYDSLTALRFKLCFNNRDYHCLFAEISNAFKRVVESTELLNLFGSLLVVGNVLNSNSFNGNAEGFALDSLESFSSDPILELLSRKTNKPRLIMELTGQPQGDGENALFKCEVSVETAISEFGEVKSLFVEECVDEGTRERFSAACERFDEMVRHYKEAQAYFGESDDRFMLKLDRFVRRLR